MIPGASLTVIFVPSAIKSPPLKDTILSTACQCRINFFSPKKRGGVNDSFFQFLQYFYLLLWLSNENLPLFISSTESFSKSQSTKHPLGGVVVPPKAPSRKGGRFAALLGFAQPGGSAAVRGACGPHTRGAPGPGPRGAPGSARRPPPVPGCPVASSRASAVLRPPVRPSRPAGLARLRRLGPSAARASPAPSGRRSLRPSLAGSAYRRGGPAPRSAGTPPVGPRLRARPRPRLRPLRLASPGASLCLALGPPSGPLRPPCGGGRPWASPGLALRARPRPGSPLARPAAFGRLGPRPAGLGPARCAPGAARPVGPLRTASPPPGLGGPVAGLCRLFGGIVVDDGPTLGLIPSALHPLNGSKPCRQCPRWPSPGG